jgi:hypothetical protein
MPYRKLSVIALLAVTFSSERRGLSFALPSAGRCRTLRALRSLAQP